MEWSLRNLLNPVITRLLVYGVHPIDLEYVLSAVEREKFRTADALQKAWLGQWEAKASRYAKLAEVAEARGHLESTHEYTFLASQCYYASFLITGTSHEVKKASYTSFAQFYEKSMRFPRPRLIRMEVPMDDGAGLPGFLHLPPAPTTPQVPCVVIFGGLGSCKEELHQLVDPLLKRGVAAFVPDLPGSGESLFFRHLPCRMNLLSKAFVRIADALAARQELLPEALGAYGLCMGGGYAHYAACIEPRYRLCATLFPLRITQVPDGVTPRWMSQGEWIGYQTGGLQGDDFLKELKPLEEGNLRVPFFLVHGRHDNWMTVERALDILATAEGPKEHLIIEEEPVFSAQQAVTHTMPVAEQLHWVRHRAADWIADHFAEITAKRQESR